MVSFFFFIRSCNGYVRSRKRPWDVRCQNPFVSHSNQFSNWHIFHSTLEVSRLHVANLNSIDFGIFWLAQVFAWGSLTECLCAHKSILAWKKITTKNCCVLFVFRSNWNNQYSVRKWKKKTTSCLIPFIICTFFDIWLWKCHKKNIILDFISMEWDRCATKPIDDNHSRERIWKKSA